MRVLRVARVSARKARTQTLNQMGSLMSTAPDDLRGELRDLNVYRLLERCSAYRPRAGRDPRTITKLTLRLLARRAVSLETEVGQLDAILDTLVEETAPKLVTRLGIGTESASALLVAAGDNPERLRSEATFAHLCRVSPSATRRGSTPSQPGRRPPSQLGALEDRPDPHGLRPPKRRCDQWRPHRRRRARGVSRHNVERGQELRIARAASPSA